MCGSIMYTLEIIGAKVFMHLPNVICEKTTSELAIFIWEKKQHLRIYQCAILHKTKYVVNLQGVSSKF